MAHAARAACAGDDIHFGLSTLRDATPIASVEEREVATRLMRL